MKKTCFSTIASLKTQWMQFFKAVGQKFSKVWLSKITVTGKKDGLDVYFF